jgi:hypothetical protein
MWYRPIGNFTGRGQQSNRFNRTVDPGRQIWYLPVYHVLGTPSGTLFTDAVPFGMAVRPMVQSTGLSLVLHIPKIVPGVHLGIVQSTLPVLIHGPWYILIGQSVVGFFGQIDLVIGRLIVIEAVSRVVIGLQPPIEILVLLRSGTTYLVGWEYIRGATVGHNDARI